VDDDDHEDNEDSVDDNDLEDEIAVDHDEPSGYKHNGQHM
jgi:hypothetical protein